MYQVENLSLQEKIDLLVDHHGSYFEVAKLLKRGSKSLKEWYMNVATPTEETLDRIDILLWLMQKNPIEQQKQFE